MNAIHKADFGVDVETDAIQTDSKTGSDVGKRNVFIGIQNVIFW